MISADRFFKGLTYGFKRNIGLTDRVIRFVTVLCMFLLLGLGIISGTIAVILGILSLMVLVTAVSSRCGITYWMDSNTMTEKEKISLKNKGISFEKDSWR